MTAPQGLMFDPQTGQYYMPTPQHQPMPAPGYAPQNLPAPGYAPQQFAPPVQYVQGPAAPAPAADRTFKGLYSQQSGGGPFWKFKERPLGTWYEGIVARPLSEHDVDVQSFEGKVQTQRDGSAKVQLNVPMIMMPSPDYPDGMGRLGVRGDLIGKLPAAMAHAGAPKDPQSDSYVPEAGAYLCVELTNLQRVPGVAQPRQVYRVVYLRPDDPHTQEVRARIEAAHAALASGQLQIQQPAPNAYYPQQGYQQGHPSQQPNGYVQGYHQPAPGYPPNGGHPGQQVQWQGQQGPAPAPAPQPVPSVGPTQVGAPAPQPVPPTGTAPVQQPPAPPAAPAAPAAGGGMPMGQIDPAAWDKLSDDQKRAFLAVTGQQAPSAGAPTQ